MVLSNWAVHQLSKQSRTVALFIVLLLVSYTAAFAEGPATVGDILARVNHERSSRGLPAFVLNSQLTAAAQWQASDIAKTGRGSHTGSDGSSTEQRVARAGYGNADRIGETWAAYHSVDQAMKFWMVSAPHKANILHPLYHDIGVGIANGSNGVVVLVLDFGAQSNSGSPVALANRGPAGGPTGVATPIPAKPGALPAAPATPVPHKAGDAAPTPTRTSTPRPSPTRTRTSTPRPRRAITIPTARPPTETPVPTEEPVVVVESTAVADTVEPQVEQVAQLVATPAPLAPVVSAVRAQATITPFDPFAASIFGVALVLGVWAVFKYVHPGV